MKKGIIVAITILVLVGLVSVVFLFNNKKEAKVSFNADQFNWQENQKVATQLTRKLIKNLSLFKMNGIRKAISTV
jgi:hypothetical protein